MTKNYNITAFNKMFLGLDSFAKDFELATSFDTNYPPFNQIKISDTEYRLEIAVAGFKQNELSVQVHDNILQVSTTKVKNKDDEESYVYVHRGLAKREFISRFKLVNYLKVTSARLADGILYIDLKIDVPEEKKPKTIDILS